MNTSRAIFGVLLAAVLCIATSPSALVVAGEARHAADPLACIPSDKRERLVLRLAEFVRLQSARDSQAAYRFLSENYKRASADGLTFESYVKHQPRNRLVRFTPSGCVVNLDEFYVIEGCAEFDRFGPNERTASSVEAVFENGDWYFSEVFALQPCLHCEPQSCR